MRKKWRNPQTIEAGSDHSSWISLWGKALGSSILKGKRRKCRYTPGSFWFYPCIYFLESSCHHLYFMDEETEAQVEWFAQHFIVRGRPQSLERWVLSSLTDTRVHQPFSLCHILWQGKSLQPSSAWWSQKRIVAEVPCLVPNPWCSNPILLSFKKYFTDF